MTSFAAVPSVPLPPFVVWVGFFSVSVIPQAGCLSSALSFRGRNVLRDRDLQGFPALMGVGAPKVSSSVSPKAVDIFSVRIVFAVAAVLLGYGTVIVDVCLRTVPTDYCSSAVGLCVLPSDISSTE